MLGKKVGVVFVVACAMFAVPSQAEVTPLLTADDCVARCGVDADCIQQQCLTKIIDCKTCCHLKLPNASREHCTSACARNLTAHVCKK